MYTSKHYKYPTAYPQTLVLHQTKRNQKIAKARHNQTSKRESNTIVLLWNINGNVRLYVDIKVANKAVKTEGHGKPQAGTDPDRVLQCPISQ